MEDCTSETPQFEEFPKIPRLRREAYITEKIDGTNAQICILEDGRVFAGSRNRWVTPAADNYGFARWVKAHEDELRKGLGVGRHHGEWWGAGIQRRYGLQEKRFSLFNTSRWKAETPALCSVVPVLASGQFSHELLEGALQRLRDEGSVAAPGFMRPEGVVVYLSAARSMFKVLLENDDMPKGVQNQEGTAA